LKGPLLTFTQHLTVGVGYFLLLLNLSLLLQFRKSLLNIRVKLKERSKTSGLMDKMEATYTNPQHTKKSKMENKKRKENA